MASGHDLRYKWLFSHSAFMQRLFQSFVQEKFVEDLVFSTLKRVDKSFVTDTFKEKESDIIYTIQFKDSIIYIFLLLEFQSTVDKNMSIRFVRCITELYESFQAKTGSGKLPAVFPILLYNGDAKWTAPFRFEERVEQSIPKEFVPHFRYFPILVNELPKESLLTIKNALSAVFYVENLSVAELNTRLDAFFSIIQDENLEVANLLSAWFNNYLTSIENKGSVDDNIITGIEI
ncbi:MAG: Rpn family recombination-promoting nuclease/putative transposase [Spirochaetia bacterium]